MDELARAKGVAPSHVGRVLRLTLLAPQIVEAILDGRQPADMGLDDLLEGFPLDWEGQRERLHGSRNLNLYRRLAVAAQRNPGRALRYAGGSARGLLIHRWGSGHWRRAGKALNCHVEDRAPQSRSAPA